MPDCWQRALDELKQVDLGLESADASDFESLAALLAARRAAIERLAGLAERSANSADSECLLKLRESASAGATLRSRLLRNVVALRVHMAASLRRRSLSRALAPDQPLRGRRLRCAG